MLSHHLLLVLSLTFSIGLAAQPRTLDLDKLPTRGGYIDLSKYAREITVQGRYRGPRLVLTNARNRSLRFKNATIESSHAEDALCISGPAVNLKLCGDLEMDGALTFWKNLNNVTIEGLTIQGAHTGIRATQPQSSQNITIRKCTLSNIKHEGIYLGPHQLTPQKLNTVTIEDNIVRRTGWDGIQVGNCQNCTITGNTIIQAARARKQWQDFGICINPGSLVYLRNNKIEQTPKRMQVLDSRAFLE